MWCEINQKPFRLLDNQIYEGNNKKLEWQCLKEECGDVFKANWNDIYYGNGCGVCVGKQVGLSNCLATKNPELASEWHPTKNGDLTPYDITEKSHEFVWWKCQKLGHEWNARVTDRNNRGCPYCSGRLPSKENNLLVINPALSEEWNYEKNDKLPEEYTPNSHDYAWWKCKDCGREWKAEIKSRNQGKGCSACSQSKGEEKIALYLKAKNRNHTSQYKIKACKNKRPLPFDFADLDIHNLNFLVEFQGIQHYEPVKHFGGEKRFKQRQINDKIKSDYCLANNIPLLIIPYWDIENIETILDNFIVERGFLI